MAALTFFGVTGTFSAALKDSVYDVDTDPELAPMSGSVTFTPLIDSGNSVPAVTLTPASNLFLVPITAAIRSGVITSNGAAGVKLVANTAVLGLTGNLYYQVDFGAGLTAGGKTYSVRPFTFQAPTTATTVDLVEVTPAVGQPATGPVPSSAVLTVAGRTGNIVITAADIAGVETTTNKNAANGYAGLDSNSKISLAAMPVGAMEYKGVWNASTNTPTLTDGTGTSGFLYRVGTAGTRNLGSGSVTWDVGDYVIHNGTVWEKSDTTDAVASVAGLTGAITSSALKSAMGIVDGAGAVTPTAVKTTGYTAAVGDLIPADATSGGFTITLPTAPADKSIVLVKKIDSSANTVTVQRGGSDVFNVASGATSLQLVLQDQTVALQYKASGGIWYVTSHGMPLAALDARFTSGNLTNPVISGGVHDVNGNVILNFAPTASAVNYLEVDNGAGTTGPTLWARGAASAADIWVAPKGTTGAFRIYDAAGNGTSTLKSDGGANTNLALKAIGIGTVQIDNLANGFATTATAAGTTTLTVTSKRIQEFTGSTTQTVTLPTTGTPAGFQFLIVNKSSGVVTVQSSGANTIVALAANTSVVVTARVATPTTAANWHYEAASAVTAVPSTATIAARDDLFTIQSAADSTKILTRNLSTIPTGVTRTMMAPVSRTSQFSLASSATETDVVTMTVPAGVLVAGSTFRIRLAGTIQVQATSGTFTLTPYLGANFAQFFVMPTQASAVGPVRFWTEWDVTVRTSGASGTFVAGGGGLIPIASWYPIGGTSSSTAVVNTTASNVVKITAQWATSSATNILLVETATIEQIV